MASLLLMGPVLAGCTAVSEEGFLPSDQGRLYINDLPASSVSAAAGASETVNVVSNVAWTATVDQTWVSIAIAGEDTPASQSVQSYGKQQLILTFDANTLANERTATLTITPADNAPNVAVQTAKITQDSPNFAVSPLQISGVRAYSPSMETIQITANNTWDLLISDEWIHPSQTGGTATEGEVITVDLTFDNNPYNSAREGEVTIKCGQQSKIVKIKQEVGSFTVSLDALDFSSTGGSKTINVSSETTWETNKKDGSWFEIDPEKGSTGGTVTITAQPNPNNAERVGEITFKSGDLTIPVKVKQLAAGLSVDNDFYEFTSAGGSETIEITCETGWEATKQNGSWFEISANKGSGNARVTLQVKPNMSSQPRHGEIIFTSGNIAVPVTVRQAEAKLSVSNTALQFSSVAGSQTIDLFTETEWTVSILDNDWITISPTHGTDNSANITISVKANTLSTQRRGIVNFQTGDVIEQVTVVQDAASLTLSQYAFNLNAGRHNELTVGITCPGAWEVTGNDAEWCQILTNKNGTGNGEVRFGVKENLEGSRSTKFYVRFGEVTQAVTINQQQVSEPVISFTDVTGDGKYSVEVSASVSTPLNVLESGFVYVEGEDLDPKDALLKRTVQCPIDGGNMRIAINNLESAVTYVVRAYVKTAWHNSEGSQIFYGDASRFTTAGLLPNDQEHPVPDTK